MGRSCSLIGFGRPSSRRHSEWSRMSSTIESLRQEYRLILRTRSLNL